VTKKTTTEDETPDEIPAEDVGDPVDTGGADEDLDEGDDEGDEDDDAIRYCVTLKSGVRSFHDDLRDPLEVRGALRLALIYPLDGESDFLEDDERKYVAAAKKADPGRYRKSGNKVYLFEVGEAGFDPREIASVCPLEDLMFQPPPEEPEVQSEQPTAAPPLRMVPAKATPTAAKIAAAVVPSAPGTGSLRERLREQIGTTPGGG